MKNVLRLLSTTTTLRIIFLFVTLLLTTILQPTIVKAQFGNNPCMGASTTKFNLTTSTLISGTAGTVGVKYRFANAYVGTPVENSIDVIAELVGIQFGTIYNSTRYTFSYDQIGNPPSASGFGVDGNFQPSFVAGGTAYTQPNGTNENLFSTWKFSFVLNSNNATLVYLPIIAQVIDNDGVAGSATSVTIRESVQSITNPTGASTAITTQQTYTPATKTFLGPAVNQAGIGVGTQFIGYFYYNNVSSITLKFNHNIVVAGGADLSNAGNSRYSSVHFGCDYTGDQNFVLQNITGTVFNDGNGQTDNTVNGTGTNAGGSLFATLYDNTSGSVLATVAVAANGTYSFVGITPGQNYTVYISTTNVPAGQTTIPTVTLPAGYVSTGEFIGAGVGSDGTVNGVLPLGTVNATLTNANFGIEQIPVSSNYTATAQANPGGTLTTTVPAAAFNGIDAEDGPYAAGLSGKTIVLNLATNGTLFYNGIAVTGSQTIPNFNPALVTVDPTAATGATTVTFPFSVLDAANQPSAQKTISMPFGTPTSIGGIIFNDPNGNAVQNSGENGTNAGGLNAVLTDAAGNVVETVAVAADGTYTFNKATASTTYNVVLSTATPAIGSVLTSSSLPNPPSGAWANTGVNPGGATPNTTNTTGILAVTTPSTGNVTNQNFAIEQTPATTNFTATPQANPGGTLTIKIPFAAFTGNDATEGAYTPGLTGRKVTLNPATNGTLFYNGVAVSSSTTFINFDPSLVTIDPAGAGTGAVTPSFTYSVFDGADKPSAPATISMPFGPGIVLSGTIFDDANGNATQNAGENGTNAGGLFAVLADAAGNVIETVAVSGTGTYTFASATSSSNYNVILSTMAPAVGTKLTLASLPAPASGAWVSTGVNPGGASPTTANKTGILNLTTPATGNATSQNFAIEQLPITNTQSYNIATPTGNSFLTLNGTGAVGSPGPLSGSDAEDQPVSGSLSTKNVQITMLPTNSNELYYNGTKILFGADGTTAPSLANPLTITNYDPSLLQLRFTGIGSMSTTFNYRYADAAGNPSENAAAYTVNFASVLPVTITAISAEENNGLGLVRWTTQQELNLLVYTVEKSENGTTFTAVGNVNPVNGGNGNSYLFSDNLKTTEAQVIYYRLKIVDNDGSFKYSVIVRIARSKTASNSILISPNPVQETMQIKVNAAASSVAVIRIISNSGQVMYTAVQQVFKGMNSIQITNLSSKFAKGTYILSIMINNENLKSGFVF